MLEERESTNVVYQGWLIKSPPMKRLWRAKWRKRFFRLRDSGELPGQYVLEYFADKTCKKLKGQIDLDQLDQCDSGLSLKDNKHRYEFMFDLQTAKRVYYLAAETEEEMNRWVEYICQVCRLKMFPQEGEGEADSYATRFVSSARHSLEASSMNQSLEHHSPTDFVTPPTSPTSSSGAYVSLSECFTGNRSFPGTRVQEHATELSYDIPRTHPQYPVSDSDSLDSVQSPTPKSTCTWDTFSREGSITKLGFNNNAPTPPRPPKTHPKVTRNDSAECYVNIAECTLETNPKSPGLDFYDMPRTHQPELTLRKPSKRNFYTNATLVDQNSRFNYDFVDNPVVIDEGTTSPPPSINRSLKPKTPILTHSPVPSTSPALSPGPLSPFVQPPPLVDRKLKPHRTLNTSSEETMNKSQHPIRAAPSPVPPLDSSDEFRHLPRPNRVRHHSDGSRAAVIVRRSSSTTSLNQTGSDRSYDHEIEYLDLDLKKDSYPSSNSNVGRPLGLKTSTVYKKVDFLKTEALKRIEEDRRREEGDVERLSSRFIQSLTSMESSIYQSLEFTLSTPYFTPATSHNSLLDYSTTALQGITGYYPQATELLDAVTRPGICSPVLDKRTDRRYNSAVHAGQRFRVGSIPSTASAVPRDDLLYANLVPSNEVFSPDVYSPSFAHQLKPTARKPSEKHIYANATIQKQNTVFNWDYIDDPQCFGPVNTVTPVVDRNLKPKQPAFPELRKPLISHSASADILSLSTHSPPEIDRKLKPERLRKTSLVEVTTRTWCQRYRGAITPLILPDTSGWFRLTPIPYCKRRNPEGEENQAGMGRSWSMTDFNQANTDSHYNDDIKYLVLDLTTDGDGSTSNGNVRRQISTTTPVVYRRIDFLKTEALKRIEEQRRREDLVKKTREDKVQSSIPKKDRKKSRD